jgi:uncharacterized phage infection (PIP) family protein YhgE
MPDSPKPERDPSEIDVRKVIEDSTEKMSLRALEKKGFKRVRVLNEEIIRNLIAQAVEAAIKSRLGDKAQLLSETGDIEEESRKELKRLMKEHAESEQAHSTASVRMSDLQTQIDALEDEIVKGRLDLEREREAIFQRGILSAQEQVRELEKKAKKLDAENAQLCASAGIERPEGGLPVGAAPANIEAMIKTVIDSIQARQDSEEISGLKDELKALADRDNKMADQMKNILREELSKRPVAAAGGMTKSQVEFAEASVESLFGEFGDEIETNIENVEAKEEKSTGVGGVLERLKRMKKGDKKDG